MTMKIKVFIFCSLIFLLFWWWLPDPLFHDPVSTVIEDRENRLLGAKISTDQQWRFPESRKIPEKFQKAIITYEDRFFRFHPGFNPWALARAAFLDLKYHKIVSGGSTITMQVIRLERKNQPRSLYEKIVEILLAFRLELSNSKANILRLYASHAPFGGNVVGLEAASWRYFNVDPDHLSWAEAATLAVLPNSPGLIYPGRNPSHLLIKRNRLLDLLEKNGSIDTITCNLAKSENLPRKPFPLPQLAPHFLDRMVKEGKSGQRIHTSIDKIFQEKILTFLSLHKPSLEANEIHNAAVLVLEVNSGNIIGYAGNLPGDDRMAHGNNVDIITAPRSTGSILKPFLYAAMLNDGLILPNTLIPDIPIQIGGFIPENYNLTYDGAVPAKQALSRSLNIPAVKMLQTYGYEQFYALLRKMGMTTLTKPADHYGLSLILGGAEATLYDLVGIYAGLAKSLNKFNEPSTGVDKTDIRQTASLDVASIWLTFEAMVEVARPDEEQQWKSFSSSKKIAWKTGTSFGNRDAWSIGVTPEYVVGVWVGNASGEGRPGLTGISVAAPILFDVFKALPPTSWFEMPKQAMIQVSVCRSSGYRASTICDVIDTIWVPKNGAKTSCCPYHQLIHLDKSEKWQVNSNCESPENMIHVPWFVLPPVQEWYYRNKNPLYKPLPPFRPDCSPLSEAKNMEIIYPKNNSKIYVPIDLDGKPGSVVIKVAHRNPQYLVYWHLDDTFLGITTQIHQMAISPAEGGHHLTLVDQKGESLKIIFDVLPKKQGNN